MSTIGSSKEHQSGNDDSNDHRGAAMTMSIGKLERQVGAQIKKNAAESGGAFFMKN